MNKFLKKENFEKITFITSLFLFLYNIFFNPIYSFYFIQFIFILSCQLILMFIIFIIFIIFLLLMTRLFSFLIYILECINY
jgi:hypothetical protein